MALSFECRRTLGAARLYAKRVYVQPGKNKAESMRDTSVQCHMKVFITRQFRWAAINFKQTVVNQVRSKETFHA